MSDGMLVTEAEFDLLNDYMDKTVKIVEIMEKSVNIYCSAGTTEFSESKKSEIIELEKELDKINREIIQSLMDSNYRSKLKSDLMSIIFAIDEIAETSRAIVAKLPFLGACDPDENLRTDLQKMMAQTNETVGILKKGFSKLLLGDFESSIEKSNEIEDREGKIDRLRQNELTPKLMEWTLTEPNPGIIALFRDIVKNIKEVIDRTKEASNAIRKVAINRA